MASNKESKKVARLARRFGKINKITGTPDAAAHYVGKIRREDGSIVCVHVVHAVDPVITDGTYVVVIDRLNEPGAGLPALPGGFMDPAEGGVESAIKAAAREAVEETGFKGAEEGVLIGTRSMYRPNDVRVATADMDKYGIKKGELFMVSTQAVLFRVSDLTQTPLMAGDDAKPGSARILSIDALSEKPMGIKDHYPMVKKALAEFKKLARPLLAARHKRPFVFGL